MDIELTEDEDDILLLLAINEMNLQFLDFIYKPIVPRRRMFTSEETGHMYVKQLLDPSAHPRRVRGVLRMSRMTLLRLVNAFKERGLLKDTINVTVEEQLAIFVIIIAHNWSNFSTGDRFNHSSETVSRHFNNVLDAIIEFSKDLIVPPSFDDTPVEIRNNRKFMPWFKDCIGAIDGTHVNAIIAVDKQVPYRSGRNNEVSQNILDVCSFDMRFTFVQAGWEGTAHDGRILGEAIRNPRINFPHPPPGKYYVVDAGYKNMPGYLAPFRGVRYHLPEFHRVGGRTEGVKEIFNHTHSSLRNVIERCFGVLKKRWPILSRMAPYPFKTQVKIVITACALHNFIRIEASRDFLFVEFDDNDMIINHDVDDEGTMEDDDDGVMGNVDNPMVGFRQSLANAMAAAQGGG